MGPPRSPPLKGRAHPRAGNPGRGSLPTGLAGRHRGSDITGTGAHSVSPPPQPKSTVEAEGQQPPSLPASPPEPPGRLLGLHGDDRWARAGAARRAGCEGMLGVEWAGKVKGRGRVLGPRSCPCSSRRGRGWGCAPEEGRLPPKPWPSSRWGHSPNPNSQGLGPVRCSGLRVHGQACTPWGEGRRLGGFLPRGSKNSLVPRKRLLNYPNCRQPLKSRLAVPD